MRGLVRGGRILEDAARQAPVDLGSLEVHLVGALRYVPSIWRLSPGFSAHDAHYVALASAVDGTLLTTDARLATTAAQAGVSVEFVDGAA